MRIPALLVASLGLVGACAGTYRYEAAGRGLAQVTQDESQASAAPGTGGVAARANVRHDVIVRVAVPRAEQVAWRLDCGGDVVSGVVGETLEAYRARRIAELRAARDRERRMVGSIAGAALGQIAGQAQVATPTGSATVTAQVDGQAAGAAVASAVVSDDVALPPGDVGGGTYVDRAIVVPPHDGACTVALWPQDGADPSGISGAFEVTRVIRRDAELRARREVQVGQAQAARVAIRAQLIAQGADVEARARAEAAVQAQLQAQAEIRFRAEASVRARAQAEAEVRAHAEAELWAEASQCRGELRAYLVAQGADPMRRRRELEARAQVELALRLRMQEEQRRRDAEAAAIAAELGHRQDLAIDARLRLRAMLLALGARERPPMPPPLDEDPGLSPSSYAAWIAGRWQWSGQAWEWQAGFWSEVAEPGAVVVDVSIDPVGDPVGGAPAGHRGLVDHRGPAIPPAPRDHRDGLPPPQPPAPPAPRDHRHDAPPPSPPRDHRDQPTAKAAPTNDTPKSRDHRH